VRAHHFPLGCSLSYVSHSLDHLDSNEVQITQICDPVLVWFRGQELSIEDIFLLTRLVCVRGGIPPTRKGKAISLIKRHCLNLRTKSETEVRMSFRPFRPDRGERMSFRPFRPDRGEATVDPSTAYNRTVQQNIAAPPINKTE
jgi:hypothetical protein